MTRIPALVGLICIASLGAASAHARLVSSEPADGALVHAGPGQLKLTFSEALEPKLSGVTVTSSARSETSTGATSLAEGGKTLIVPLQAPLEAGTYTVDWHALSRDGHTTHSSYSFTVAP